MEQYKSAWRFWIYTQRASLSDDRKQLEQSRELINRSRKLLARCQGDYSPLLPKPDERRHTQRQVVVRDGDYVTSHEQ